MRHTQGPWSRNIKAGGKYPAVFAGRNTHVAIAQQMATPEETEANISLIAAAPDLLEALQWLYAICLADELLPDSVSYMQTAEKAIKKACGE